MIQEFGEDECNYVLKAMRLVEVLKFLQLEGFTFKDIDIEVGEDAYYQQDEFLESALRAMRFGVHTDYANDESGKFKGYELTFDPDEVSCTEMILTHPELLKYLAWARTRGIKVYDLPIAKPCLKLARPVMWNSDYMVIESFLAEDYTGICILQNDPEFIELTFFKSLLEIIDFCKIENASRKAKHRYPRRVRKRGRRRSNNDTRNLIAA